MARPERNTVDYYPHMVGDGKKMFFIEKKYANDGYATWHKILEKLCSTEYHFLNLNKEEEIMHLSAKCNVTEEVLLNIVFDLVKLGAFDKEMWDNKIIWCQQLIESIDDAYLKRNNDCMSLLGLRELLTGLGILKPILKDENRTDNPQSRVEKSKVEKSRLFVPPSAEEVEQYFTDNGYDKKVAAKAFKWYNDSDWNDSHGKPVKNWKTKMQKVWFTEENLADNSEEPNYTPPEPMNKRQPIMGK